MGIDTWMAPERRVMAGVSNNMLFQKDVKIWSPIKSMVRKGVINLFSSVKHLHRSRCDREKHIASSTRPCHSVKS